LRLTREAGTSGLLVAQGLKKVRHDEHRSIILTLTFIEWHRVHHLRI
jgi:hypothetical protein